MRMGEQSLLLVTMCPLEYSFSLRYQILSSRAFWTSTCSRDMVHDSNYVFEREILNSFLDAGYDGLRWQ